MFFTLRNRFGVRGIQEINSRERIFGSHRFMSEVGADKIRGRNGNHAAEQERTKLKGLLGQLVRIAFVPEYKGTRTAIPVCLRRMDQTGRCAACYQIYRCAGNFFYFLSQRENRFKSFMNNLSFSRYIGITDMPVISMKSLQYKNRI